MGTSVMGTQHLHLRQLIHLIATSASRIGRRAGQWKRKLGAAHTMARVAVVVADVLRLFQHLHHMIATPDLPTGPPVGPSPKRLGAAAMPERAAPHRMAAVPDSHKTRATL